MANLNDEMKTVADYAIRSAKEMFGQDLDFSVQSLGKLESLLAQAYQSISLRVKDEKTALAVTRTANIWGAYFGEIIRLSFGGSWVLKGSERLLNIIGFEVSPIGFVFQKITNHPEYIVKDFYAEIRMKISNLQVEQPRLQRTSEYFSSISERDIIEQKKDNSINIDKSIFYSIAMICGVLLIAGAFIVGFSFISGGGVSTEFRSNLSIFITEAEKLNVMTDQGVSNQDFRNQLAEVKSAYSALNGLWPTSLSAEMNTFAHAIKGWDITLQVWDHGLESNTYFNLVYIPEGSTLLKECSEYSNIKLEYAMFNSVDVWLGILMATASQYYEEGRSNTNSKLK